MMKFDRLCAQYGADDRFCSSGDGETNRAIYNALMGLYFLLFTQMLNTRYVDRVRTLSIAF